MAVKWWGGGREGGLEIWKCINQQLTSEDIRMNCIAVASTGFPSCCSFFGLPVRLSRSWILQLQLSLRLTVLVCSIWQFKAWGENYRSQHMGTGRMWLLKTTQPRVMIEEKEVWILQLDLLFFTAVHWVWGISMKTQFWTVSRAFPFWVLDYSGWAMSTESIYAKWLQEQGERDAWMTETLQRLLSLLSLPLRKSCLMGLQRCVKRDWRGMLNGWWGNNWCYRSVPTTLRAMIPCAAYEVCTGALCVWCLWEKACYYCN